MSADLSPSRSLTGCSLGPESKEVERNNSPLVIVPGSKMTEFAAIQVEGSVSGRSSWISHGATILQLLCLWAVRGAGITRVKC